MAWTYSGDPAASDSDTVRFLIGDTDSSDQLLQDAEIAYALAENSTVELAAAVCAEAVAAKFARRANKSVDGLSISYQQQSQQYRDLANELRQKAAVAGAAPYAGGISKADKESQEDDSDRVVPAFTIGIHDYDSDAE